MRLSLSRSDDGAAGWPGGGVVGELAEIADSLGSHEASVDVILVDDAHIRRINRDYRGQDKPTDVISFSYLDGESLGDHDDLAGEIYISHQTLEKEASELGVHRDDLFLRLGVHGLFHILGRDHDTDERARAMEAEERRVLARYLESDVIAVFF